MISGGHDPTTFYDNLNDNISKYEKNVYIFFFFFKYINVKEKQNTKRG